MRGTGVVIFKYSQCSNLILKGRNTGIYKLAFYAFLMLNICMKQSVPLTEVI